MSGLGHEKQLVTLALSLLGRHGTQGHPSVAPPFYLGPQEEKQSPTWAPEPAGQGGRGLSTPTSTLLWLLKQLGWFSTNELCAQTLVCCVCLRSPRNWHHAACAVWAPCAFLRQTNDKQIGCEWI